MSRREEGESGGEAKYVSVGVLHAHAVQAVCLSFRVDLGGLC